MSTPAVPTANEPHAKKPLDTTQSLRLTQFNHVLRAIGLEILALFHIKRQLKQKKIRGEPAKPVILTSLPTALARCCVHIIPILGSITVIMINLLSMFLGPTIPGQILNNSISFALLQFAAKIQELLIVASLSTIIFEVIRNMMIRGDGIPLGFLVAGFLFSDLNYMWSAEFWGGLGARISLRKKISLGTLLAISTLIAATVGPSCAILLIPREQGWEAGKSDFYLRRLNPSLFPDLINASTEPLSVCRSGQSINNAVCPSGGFYSLLAYSSFLPMIRNSANLFPNLEPTYVNPLPSYTTDRGFWGTQTIKMASTLNVVPEFELNGNIRGLVCQTSLVAPFLPVVMYQAQLSKDFYGYIDRIPPTSDLSMISVSEYQHHHVSRDIVSTRSRLPTVRVVCSEGQNVSSSSKNIRFPVLPGYSCWRGTELSQTVLELDNEPKDHIRTTWVSLPSTFGSVSHGIVFEAPWAQDNASRLAVGCSVDARWSSGSINGASGLIDDQGPAGLWRDTPGFLVSPFRPYPNSGWYRIRLERDWLDILTPFSNIHIPGFGTRNLSTIENIFTNSAVTDAELTSSIDQTATWNEVRMGGSNRTLYLEWILAMLLTDGLARGGTSKVLNTTGSSSHWSLLDYVPRSDFNQQIIGEGHPLEKPTGANTTTFQWTLGIPGLSYKANLMTDYLAIAVLLAHIPLALGHTIWLLYRRQSSGCWDTISEILVLAQNSRPPEGPLRNTTSGIKCLNTFGIVAKVRVVRNEEPDSETGQTPAYGRVQLVFSGHNDEVEDNSLDELEEAEAGLGPTSSGVSQRGSVASQSLLLRPVQRSRSVTGTGGAELDDEMGNVQFEIVRPDRLYH